MPLLTHKMPLGHQEGVVMWIFVRSANHNKFFNDFCKTQAQFENVCRTVSSCNPFSSWPFVANSFTELLWCLNKELTSIF